MLSHTIAPTLLLPHFLSLSTSFYFPTHFSLILLCFSPHARPPPWKLLLSPVSTRGAGFSSRFIWLKSNQNGNFCNHSSIVGPFVILPLHPSFRAHRLPVWLCLFTIAMQMMSSLTWNLEKFNIWPFYKINSRLVPSCLTVFCSRTSSATVSRKTKGHFLIPGLAVIKIWSCFFN